MKNKKLLFFVILLFPALLKIILEFTTINSRKLPYYGPKTAVGVDTVFYKVGSLFKTLPANSVESMKQIELDTVAFPLYAVCFIKQSYKKDDYRMAGLAEYAQYKKDKIKYIPFIIVTPCDGSGDTACLKEMGKLSVGNENILNLYWQTNSFDSLNKSYFKEKPMYIDYSFFVLVDKKRHIRGYYDARYIAEIKRLTEEYQHLRLKEEKEQMVKVNKIERK
ncbi:MAG: hypothetical protein K0S53_2438 [Bacteroidetes bacterium]|jgi:hypothetical protein|nr:hypothetical protein [Bacteroidota bacterium]MDF2453197.1 hypothetical protein [Bacteroidota bacterium]